MAAIYKVGKKWRADWTDNDGVRHRQRFNTKGRRRSISTASKASFAPARMLRRKRSGSLALADSWITNRIEQSRTPGAGYRPSSLAQWQSHIAHMKVCFENLKVTSIDAQAIERAISTWCF